MEHQGLIDKLMSMKIKEEKEVTSKVSIVGVGEIGSAVAYTLLGRGLCNELALCDIREDDLNGELLDLQEGLAFRFNMKITGSTNPEITANSKIVIIAAGQRQQPGESCEQLLDKNIGIFKDMVPKLAKYSPDAVLFVVSNPVDVLTYVTWKLSGFPFERVIGHGTSLDSQRFRYYLGEKLQIAPNSLSAWIIGVQGQSAVPVWSSISVAGVDLVDLNPSFGKSDDPEKWHECFSRVLESVDKITKLKGYTNWAPALSVAQICQAILKNEKTVYCLSTCAKHWNCSQKYGLNSEVFFSLPCVIGQHGVVSILAQKLTDEESQKLKKSAQCLSEAQQKLHL